MISFNPLLSLYQAVSDVNITLDGATYPGWNMSRDAMRKLF